jgi:hypothetical protein
MNHEVNKPSLNLIKRKIELSESSELEVFQSNAIKIPNNKTSPLILPLEDSNMTNLTIDDLEELKIQLLGLIHHPKWEFSLQLFHKIMDLFQSMNYDINFSYQPYIKAYTINLQYPWYSRAQRQSNSYVTNSVLNSRILCILPLSPLHYAAYLGSEEFILPLLRYGANKSLHVLNYTSYEFANKTAAEIALQRGYHRIFHMIEEYDPMEIFIPRMNDIHIVKQLGSEDEEESSGSGSVGLPRPRLNRVSSNEIFLTSSSPSKSDSNLFAAYLAHQSSAGT